MNIIYECIKLANLLDALEYYDAANLVDDFIQKKAEAFSINHSVDEIRKKLGEA